MPKSPKALHNLPSTIYNLVMASKKHLYTRLGTLLWVMAAIFALLPSWPHLYYRMSPKASQALAQTIADTTTTPPPTSPPPSTPTIYDPRSTSPLTPIDPSLPDKNGLIIDSIGVRGEINEGQDWETILKKGIWRVPDFATPSENCDLKSEICRPIILAAHRWGYLEWTNGFRKLNSFYNLPKIKVGDTIKIVWEQRQFEYKVYAVTSGTSIPEYKANLILYTCQLWNSPVRFFVFANRVN